MKILMMNNTKNCFFLIIYLYICYDSFIMNNHYITNTLKQLRPYTKISKESIDIILKIFTELNITPYQDIIKKLSESQNDLLNGAITESNKKNDPLDKKNAIIGYILAEILDLSSNVTRDNNLKTIIANHIWLAIFNDNGLKQLFSQYIPSISPYHRITSENVRYKPRLNKIKKLLNQHNIKYEPIIIKTIAYILTYFTNLCTSPDEIKSRILFYNPDALTYSIIEYQDIILNKLIDKMILANEKINYTILNEIFEVVFPNTKFDINY